jgi:hypothetical protein
MSRAPGSRVSNHSTSTFQLAQVGTGYACSGEHVAAFEKLRLRIGPERRGFVDQKRMQALAYNSDVASIGRYFEMLRGSGTMLVHEFVTRDLSAAPVRWLLANVLATPMPRTSHAVATLLGIGHTRCRRWLPVVAVSSLTHALRCALPFAMEPIWTKQPPNGYPANLHNLRNCACLLCVSFSLNDETENSRAMGKAR